MKLNKDSKILIVGLGVIGGGYASALSSKGYTVKCITKEKSDIAYAIERGMITDGSTEPEPELIGWADLIIFALYPTVFIEWIKNYQQHISSNTLITDVTGVKNAVVKEIQGVLRDDIEFIAAHPMAGRERSGVEYSDPKVFEGANYIITPTDKNTAEAISVCRELGEVLGFGKISILTVKEHDEMIAFLSQLTHCIAISLMTCNNTPDLEKYTGDSFRDLTRIAKINDRMWSELFLMNRDILLEQMDIFAKEFERLKSMISVEDAEGIREMMRKSTARRSLFDKPAK